MKPIVVIKVGGSLLDWPGLPLALSAFLDVFKANRPVLIVGGGRFADALRDLDEAIGLGEARSHALALRVLDVTAHLLADLMPGLVVVERREEMEAAWPRGVVPVLAPRRFLDDDARSPDALPQTWATTTDSIAARVAVRVGAGELVLLKSTTPPGGLDAVEAARLGLVDPEFPGASNGVPIVSYRNLRDPSSLGPVAFLPPQPRTEEVAGNAMG